MVRDGNSATGAGFDPEACLDAWATAIDLPIPASCRAGVAANLARTFGFAALLLDMEELVAIEPAPFFRVLEDGP